jgi:hypothetical protein
MKRGRPKMPEELKVKQVPIYLPPDVARRLQGRHRRQAAADLLIDWARKNIPLPKDRPNAKA